jgi:uncharacterized protein (DUF885 family)
VTDLSAAMMRTGSNQGPRPETDADRRFEELVGERFERLLREFPIFGTWLGVHNADDRLGDLSREAKLQQIADEHRFLDDLQALDAAELSEPFRFERELALNAAERSLFDDEVHRLWERRASASDEIGDGLFLLFARDFAPLAERLVSITGRLEDSRRVLRDARSRMGESPVRLWNQMELDSTESLPTFLDEILAAARGEWPAGSRELARLEKASESTTAALGDYSVWLREVIERSSDDFALGSEDYDRLVNLRAFDGLTTDDILQIGVDQLTANHEGRRQAAAEIDPSADVREVLTRVKEHHPHTFEEALEGYRDAMFRARDYIREHDLATLPENESLSVIPTPEYLRNVMPFAAYFQPAKFDARRRGIYIVTPSVDGDPRAMMEHNWASISNTSIHEAYPGHHQQLTAAVDHPSVTRLLVDAPEFVEGWGMYCEQMMREQGFDASPEHRVIMYTDAIWRACRIILDVRLHRGEISVADAIEFLVSETGFERPQATAEVHRYTYTPTYQLSYLLGKVMLLRLRADEQRRLGDAFSLRDFHDALIYSGSIPVSFHRRLLAGEGGGPTMPGTVAQGAGAAVPSGRAQAAATPSS